MNRTVSLKRKRKPLHNRAVRLHITLDPTLSDRSPEVFRRFAFSGLSDYVSARLRKDLGIDLPA